MKNGNYIQVNGAFVAFAEYKVSLGEADGLLFCEKIRSIRTSFPFLRENIELIKLKLSVFNQSCPALMDNESAELKRQMERTLTKNKHFLGAILSIRFWLSEQKLQYSIHSIKTEHSGYELNNKGIYITICRQIRKPFCALTNNSLGSAMYWKIAQAHLKDKTYELVLINDKGQILEAPQSNIYIIKDETIKGASIEQGAYCDISKLLLLDIFEKMNLSYHETQGITEKDLREADEIFLVNSLEGIRWVIGFEGKRYFNQVIRKINNAFINNFIS